MQGSHSYTDNLNTMGLGSKTVNAVNKESQQSQSHPQQQHQKIKSPVPTCIWDLHKIPCTWQSLLPCQGLHMLIMWQDRPLGCQMPKHFWLQKDPNKKPLRHGPKGGKQKQTHTVDVDDDYDPQFNEVHVITIDVHPHHSAQLGQKSKDDHVRPSALSPQVAQNAHSATILPPSACPTQ